MHFKRLRFYRHETTNDVILSGYLFWRCDNCDNNVGSSHTSLETGQSQQPLFPLPAGKNHYGIALVAGILL